MKNNYIYYYKGELTDNILTKNTNKLTINFELKPNPLFLSLTLDKNITIKSLDAQCGNEIYGMSQTLESNIKNFKDRKEFCYLMIDKNNPFSQYKLRKNDKPLQIINNNKNIKFFYIPFSEYKKTQNENYKKIQYKEFFIINTEENYFHNNKNKIKNENEIENFFLNKEVYRFSKRKKIFVHKKINLNENYFWISNSKKKWKYDINDIIYFGKITEKTKILNLKSKEKNSFLFEIDTYDKNFYVFQANNKEDFFFIFYCFNVAIEKNKIINIDRMFFNIEIENKQKNEIYFQFFINNSIHNFNYLISNYYSRKLFFNCFRSIKNYDDIINNIINYQIFIKNKKFEKVLVLFKQISVLLKIEGNEIIKENEKKIFDEINNISKKIISDNISLNKNNIDNNCENKFNELFKIEIFNNIFNNIINKYYKNFYEDVFYSFQNNIKNKNILIFKRNLSYLLPIYFMKNFNFNCNDIYLLNYNY